MNAARAVSVANSKYGFRDVGEESAASAPTVSFTLMLCVVAVSVALLQLLLLTASS